MVEIEKVIEELNKANKELIGTDNDVINGLDIGCVIDEARHLSCQHMKTKP